MLQLFCPACEDVVWMDETAKGEPTPCPTCGHELPAAGRRKARPVHDTAPVAPRAPVDVRVKPAAEPRKKLSAPVTKMAPSITDAANEDFTVPWSEPIPRFVPLPYRPEGGIDLLRFPFFAGLLLAGGLFAGWLMSTLGQECYLILLFPLGAGIALAGVGLFGAHVTRMRSTGTGGTVAVLAAAVAIVGMHWWDYQRADHMRTNEPHRVPSEVRERLAEQSTFVGYLESASAAGWTVSGSKGAGFNLGCGGTIAYWFGEFFIVAGLAVVGVRYGACEPFCSRCRRMWKDERLLGGVHDRGDLEKLLERGNLAGLVDYRPDPKSGDVALTVAVCPHCKADAPIDLLAERIRGRGPRGVMAHFTYPGEALAVVESVFG